jgi:cell division protein FtsX
VGVVLNAPFPRRRRLLNVVRNTFRHLFLDAARAWIRNLGATGPALGSMTLLLLLSGLVGLTAYTMQRLAATQATDAAVLHVYLRDDAKPADVTALQHAQSRPGRSCRAGSVGTNPPVDPILPTSYNPTASDRIQKALLIVGIAGAVFLLLLGFVAVAVTANSIRSTILARQNEVAIMQLVGARRWMVRGPFLVEGAITGGVAGLAAGLVTLVAGVSVVAAGRSTFAQIAPGVDVGVCLLAAGIVVVAGLVLGSAASLYSVHRQLES